MSSCAVSQQMVCCDHIVGNIHFHIGVGVTHKVAHAHCGLCVRCVVLGLIRFCQDNIAYCDGIIANCRVILVNFNVHVQDVARVAAESLVCG